MGLVTTLVCWFIPLSILLAYTALNTKATIVNGGRQISCHKQLKIYDVRIKNCTTEPCNIRKGDQVPVEIDFEFTKPNSTKDVEFVVRIANWNTPPNAFGSLLIETSHCSELNLTCPTLGNKNNTIMSSLFIDPLSKDILRDEEIGRRTTHWIIKVKQDDKHPAFICKFDVKLNITK